MVKKIALEEHFATPLYTEAMPDPDGEKRDGQEYTETVNARLWASDNRDYSDALNRLDIEHVVMSLTSPGVQGILDTQKAVEIAKDANDKAASHYVADDSDLFSFFAAVPLQDPNAAIKEAKRAVNDLHAKGILINGYTNIGDVNKAMYLDDPSLEEFWSVVNDLNVPVYLHPRSPIPAASQIYEGYEQLQGSPWGFTQETAIHALRLIMSGLLDRYPNLTIILGHLGEGLSQTVTRTEHRLYRLREGQASGKNKYPLSKYLRENFRVTTSGHSDTNALKSAIHVFGAEHVMFSVDYPFELMAEAVKWFDELDMPEQLKEDIAYNNAAKLLKV